MHDPTTNDHIFNALRREFTEEFPNLTLIFIPYTRGGRAEAFAKREKEIMNHPAGEKVISIIKKDLHNYRAESYCGAVAEHVERRFFGVYKVKTYLGVCFVNIADIHLFDDITFSSKCMAYYAAFEALDIYLENTGFNQEHHLQKSEQQQDKSSAPQKIRMQLMSDCFSAIMMESIGGKGAIKKIVKKYSESCISNTIYFRPENHPLPMSFDAISLVYKDLKDASTSGRMGLIAQSYIMSREIGETYDDLSMLQWQQFCRNAQDMAWADYNTNEILSAAIYTSDNAYIRSNAQICAENLNLTPVPLKDTSYYNPFAQQDNIARIHERLARAAFAKLLEVVRENGTPELFIEAANKQTKALFKGRPLGWCAPALIEAENAYRLRVEAVNPQDNDIENAFEAAFSKLHWLDIQRINRRLITAQRNDISINTVTALNILSKDESFAAIQTSLELMS